MTEVVNKRNFLKHNQKEAIKNSLANKLNQKYQKAYNEYLESDEYKNAYKELEGSDRVKKIKAYGEQQKDLLKAFSKMKLVDFDKMSIELHLYEFGGTYISKETTEEEINTNIKRRIDDYIKGELFDKLNLNRYDNLHLTNSWGYSEIDRKVYADLEAYIELLDDTTNYKDLEAEALDLIDTPIHTS